ncbi:hypothetical protein L917_19355 [Phytophthora nicotianae]|nr:hypothetical protein L917_19355 [Phytophthora nicotianae]
MYNVVVGLNLNKKLNLRRRSYATLAPKIEGISKKEFHQTNKQSFVGTRGLFHFESQGMVDDGATGHEQAFQIDYLHRPQANGQVSQKMKSFCQSVRLCKPYLPRYPPEITFKPDHEMGIP